MRALIIVAIVGGLRSAAAAQPAGGGPPSLTPATPAPTVPAGPVGDERGGFLLGMEFGAGRGAQRLTMFELEAKAGWVFRSKAALFATVSAGIFGASEGLLHATLGVGGRMWSGRVFLDVRFERMSVGVLDCEETCSSIGINRYSFGGGFDAVRGRHGGMELSLRVVRFADLTAAMVSIGGYAEL